ISPQELLVNRAGQEIQITIADIKGKERNAVIKVLSSENHVLYREWVNLNRKFVHRATKGKAGYLHIPDMGPRGFSEFHRAYLTEIEKPALIIDVRYNGGGHVSQLLLEKLARKRLGYDISRWFPPEPYPSDSLLGPMVALTNEQAGSDGDIFSHCFKLMKLGTLIGKRTWGGVIGIWPRHLLSDGTITTQPEFSFWFKDVGWKVENYGTDPDIEVEIAPQDYMKGKDAQLEYAVSEILKLLDKNPVKIPDFKDKPNLAFPKTTAGSSCQPWLAKKSKKKSKIKV
ncbi:MAG: S41 family peptidase, partial [Elusimicrobiota bacterium]